MNYRNRVIARIKTEKEAQLSDESIAKIKKNRKLGRHHLWEKTTGLAHLFTFSKSPTLLQQQLPDVWGNRKCRDRNVVQSRAQTYRRLTATQRQSHTKICCSWNTFWGSRYYHDHQVPLTKARAILKKINHYPKWPRQGKYLIWFVLLVVFVDLVRLYGPYLIFCNPKPKLYPFAVWRMTN